MTEWKEYKLAYIDIDWEMRIKLRQDKETESKCRETVEFFSGGEAIIDHYNYDVFKAFAAFIAPEVMWLSSDYNLPGIIKKFEDKEGFYPFTEENGINLCYVGNFELGDYTDFVIDVIDNSGNN